MQHFTFTSPLQKLDSNLLRKKKIELYVKRDDLIHSSIQGNKWRKLKYNLQEAKEKNYKTLLTFGGAYSNHIYATAAAANYFHFNSIGIIRGEEPNIKSETLEFALSKGMQIHYVNRTMYRNKFEKSMIENLQNQLGDFYLIPEGGTNIFALKGVAEIVKELEVEFDYISTTCGTGGTLAGLTVALQGEKKILGISSLKGKDTLTEKVHQLTSEYCNQRFQNFTINTDYHFGGYAKTDNELFAFILDFKKQFNILLEPVYTGKMFFGLIDLIRKDFFEPGSRIIALHTGGLQGLSGFPELKKLLLA